jgi:lysozyme
MSINKRTIALVKEFEGYMDRLPDGRCMAYLDRNATQANPNYDHKAGGLWTIGYGATGPGITKGTIWTQAQADADLGNRLEKHAQEVDAQLTVKVNPNQRGALASISYNVGTYGIRGLIAKVNEDPDNAGPYFAAYKYGTQDGQKVVLRGLVRRRTAERELYEWEDKKQVAAMSPEINTAQRIQGGILASLGLGGLSWDQIHSFMQDHQGMVLIGVALGAFALTKIWEWGYHKAFDKGTYVPTGTKPVPTDDEMEALNVDIE